MKSFPLELLEQISNCFTNPVQGKYGWTGLNETAVAYINDFRWWEELIAWQELSNLLEGTPCKLSCPKNIFATDIHIPRSTAIPIFAAGICPIEYLGAYGLRDERETVMMDSRWRIFNSLIKYQTMIHQIFLPVQNHGLLMLGSAN